MNRKQFVVILVALAVIGAAGLVLFKRNQQSWAVRETKAGDPVLPNFKFNEVTSIHVQGRWNFNVVRKNGLWIVPERADYPANFPQISDLLMKLRDLKVLQSDVIGPSQLAPLGLTEPGSGPDQGTLFEFKDEQGKLLGAMRVGKRHMRPESASDPYRMKGLFDSCYVLVPSDPGNVLLVSDDLGGATPDPGSWLKHDFFKVENIRTMSFISSIPGESWEISRAPESTTWVLADAKPGEALSAKVANNASEIMAFPSFVDVVPNTQSNKVALGPSPSVLTVLADHFAYTLKIGPKQDGVRFMTVAVAGEIPSQRTIGKDETPEDSERQDRIFQKTVTELKAKLAREQALASWIYAADSWIELVCRNRSEMLEKAAVAAPESAGR